MLKRGCWMQENDILLLHKEIATLKSQISSSQDRSLRSTLIFRAIDYCPENEFNPDKTIDILASKVTTHCPNVGSQFFKSAVERGHRNFKRGRDQNSSSLPPSISVKFLSWKDSNHILNAFIQRNKNKNPKINVSQQFSSRTTERRHSALFHRLKLKEDNPNKEYELSYPATLLGRVKDSNTTFKLIKKF